MNSKINFINTNPAKLSGLLKEIESIEGSGVYSNYGPINQSFENRAIEELFGGTGSCVTNCNATIGLMLAIKEATQSAKRKGRYAIMPSFTFAATAHAAIWAGLTPLLCDIDAFTWSLDPNHENELIEKYGDEIAVIVPYATFGTNIDLDRYETIYREKGLPTVVDAAASLGSKNAAGDGFGKGFNQSIVYSMHVTKTFSTYEGGLIYSNDAQRVKRLRAMGNFGFEQPRTASLPGLNSKLSEIGSLIALKKLDSFKSIVESRFAKANLYIDQLPDFKFQKQTGAITAYQFMPILLDANHASKRMAIVEEMASRGIMTANYFSPHIAEQSYFMETCVAERLTITNEIANRILSLPLYDNMSDEEVAFVAWNLRDIISTMS